MKHRPCFQTNQTLEEAARLADQRKHQAIDRLNEKLGQPEGKDAFTTAMEALIDADKAALKERGR